MIKTIGKTILIIISFASLCSCHKDEQSCVIPTKPFGQHFPASVLSEIHPDALFALSKSFLDTCEASLNMTLTSSGNLIARNVQLCRDNFQPVTVYRLPQQSYSCHFGQNDQVFYSYQTNMCYAAGINELRIYNLNEGKPLQIRSYEDIRRSIVGNGGNIIEDFFREEYRENRSVGIAAICSEALFLLFKIGKSAVLIRLGLPVGGWSIVGSIKNISDGGLFPSIGQMFSIYYGDEDSRVEVASVIDWRESEITVTRYVNCGLIVTDREGKYLVVAQEIRLYDMQGNYQRRKFRYDIYSTKRNDKGGFVLLGYVDSISSGSRDDVSAPHMYTDTGCVIAGDQLYVYDNIASYCLLRRFEINKMEISNTGWIPRSCLQLLPVSDNKETVVVSDYSYNVLSLDSMKLQISPLIRNPTKAYEYEGNFQRLGKYITIKKGDDFSIIDVNDNMIIFNAKITPDNIYISACFDHATKSLNIVFCEDGVLSFSNVKKSGNKVHISSKKPLQFSNISLRKAKDIFVDSRFGIVVVGAEGNSYTISCDNNEWFAEGRMHYNITECLTKEKYVVYSMLNALCRLDNSGKGVFIYRVDENETVIAVLNNHVIITNYGNEFVLKDVTPKDSIVLARVECMKYTNDYIFWLNSDKDIIYRMNISSRSIEHIQLQGCNYKDDFGDSNAFVYNDIFCVWVVVPWKASSEIPPLEITTFVDAVSGLAKVR